MGRYHVFKIVELEPFPTLAQACILVHGHRTVLPPTWRRAVYILAHGDNVLSIAGSKFLPGQQSAISTAAGPAFTSLLAAKDAAESSTALPSIFKLPARLKSPLG
jgi:hypothetical protein